LFWLSSYVASCHLAVAPQSGAKDQLYITVYYITLNLKSKEHLKSWGKMWKLGLEDKIN
jgi:hypothetical protein